MTKDVRTGRLPKPAMGTQCSSCGYCCTAQPCTLATEFLNCTVGPCWALENGSGDQKVCGLVRNPLGYLFKAAHPESDVNVIGDAPESEEGYRLSSRIASALGLGMGCDAADDADSEAWNAGAWPSDKQG